MASIVIFLKTPDWTWHHDPVYLLGHATVRMYIFFSRPVLSLQFDPEFPFNGVPLHVAYLPYPSPSPPPSPSTETDPSEDNSSSSSSGGDQVVPELAQEGFPAMENGFYTPWWRHGSYLSTLLLIDHTHSYIEILHILLTTHWPFMYMLWFFMK